MSAKRTPKEGAAASSLQNMLTKGRKRKGRDSDEESDYRLRLSEYEKNRPRIEALPDASPITIEWKALKEEFTCPVCRGLLDRTMITVECMHRFCFNCIRDALFKGNKQCPTCRRECPAMRNLRHDERFDQMIQVLFGGPQEANEDIINTEEIVARRMAEVRRMYEEGMKKQAERRKSRAGSSSGHRRPRENSHGYSDNDTEDDFENADMSSASETEESFLQSRQRASHVDEVDGIWPLDGFEEPDSNIEVTLVSDPTDDRLPIGEVIRIRTMDNCTIAHLLLVLQQYYLQYHTELVEKLAETQKGHTVRTTRRSQASIRLNFTIRKGLGAGAEKEVEAGLSLGEVKRMLGKTGVVVLYHAIR